MAVLGRACLLLALAICAYGIVAAVYGARTGQRVWAESGRRSVYALFGVVTVAFAILEGAFLGSDFHFNTVAAHSSTTTPTFYKAAAMWSSQEGSLLLWLWLLSGWSSLVLFLTRRRLAQITPYATAVVLGFAGFFSALLVFFASPFVTSAVAPSEGAGLNPLLRHPSMMIHPPMLYSGYTLFTIPFAFAIGALITGQVNSGWIQATRRFALAAWFFLGIGIVLGARWSYAELGWGGYWAWDPVENAALMPWLTGTAFLHSAMIQEKRGMLKAWNVSLVLASGTLAILGTFLVRSGILDSIHAFGASTLGVPFVILIGVLVAGSVGLVVSRRDALRSDHHLDSLLSREAVFLANNLVLVGLCFVVFWGTFFPLISEAVTGSKASVGPPWFDRYTVPLALVLVLLSGVGPVIAWRRASLVHAVRNFRAPIGAALLALCVLLSTGAGAGHPLALGMFCAGAFVLTSVAQEFWRGTRARRAMSGEGPAAALVALVRRNRRRYGGYVVHVGVAVLFVGVAASSSFRHESELSLSPGQSARVGAYTVRYVRPTANVFNDPKHTGSILDVGAVLDVTKHGRHVVTLNPSRGYYDSADPSQGSVGHLIGGEAVSHVGLSAGPLRDFWSAIEPNLSTPDLQRFVTLGNQKVPLVRPDEGLVVIALMARHYLQHPPPAQFHFLDSPLVTWIWAGGLIVFGGGLIALWPLPVLVRRRLRSTYPAPVTGGLGRAAAP